MIDESVAACGCVAGLGKRIESVLIGVKVSTGNGKAFIAYVDGLDDDW